MTTSVRPGLYHVRLLGARGSYERSEGTYLLFKRSHGYFMLPGDSSYRCVAFAVGSPAGDGSVEVQVDASLIGDPDGEPLLRRANPMPRQRRRDRFWSDVAKHRNAGHPISHFFGTVIDLKEVMALRRAVFRPMTKLGEVAPNVELELLSIIRPEKRAN